MLLELVLLLGLRDMELQTQGSWVGKAERESDPVCTQAFPFTRRGAAFYLGSQEASGRQRPGSHLFGVLHLHLKVTGVFCTEEQFTARQSSCMEVGGLPLGDSMEEVSSDQGGTSLAV